MYLYLYDASLSGKSFQHQLARIETRLTDLGISGKISRLSPHKNLQELIHDEVANGVRTIVAVGGDGTFISVVNEIMRHNGLTLGHIPLGPKTKIAGALGIPLAEEACDVIAARRLVRLDVGRANNTYFLSALTIPQSQVTLELDGRYQVKPNSDSYAVSICNLRPDRWNDAASAQRFRPNDGFLETLIESLPVNVGIFGRRRRAQTPSILPCRKVKITSSKSVTVLTDGERILKTPVLVEVVPQKLQVIVGRERKF